MPPVEESQKKINAEIDALDDLVEYDRAPMYGGELASNGKHEPPPKLPRADKLRRMASRLLEDGGYDCSPHGIFSALAKDATVKAFFDRYYAKADGAEVVDEDEPDDAAE